MHTRRQTRLQCLTVLCLGCALAPALAQIYGGTNDHGVLVLSSSLQSGVEQSVVVDAPAPAAALGTGAAPALRRYLPQEFDSLIQEASATYQLPTALIHAVIAVESNYRPDAVSPKGAQGLMQLMPATAQRFGAFNSLDPRDNILTGSRYLRWLLDYFQQDLVLAVAAYNAGENAVMRAGRRIPRFSETERYVPKVLNLYQQLLRR